MESKLRMILICCLTMFGLNATATILTKGNIRYEYYSQTNELNNCDSIYLGFNPISSENFKPLLKIVGNCSIDTVSTQKVQFLGSTYLISTQSGDTISASSTHIVIAELLGDIGSQIAKYKLFKIAGDKFSPEYIRFVNPSTMSTQDSELQMGGLWNFSEFPLWNYILTQDAYVRFKAGKPFLPDFEKSITLTQLQHTGATFESLNLNLTHRSDSIFNITGSGILKFENSRFEVKLGKNNFGGIQLTNGKPDTISVIVTDSFKISNLKMYCHELALEYIKSDSSYSFYGDSLKIIFNTNEIALKLGDKKNPGARFKGNKLQSMMCTLIDTTSLFGLKIKGKGITMAYQNNDFAIYGENSQIKFKNDSIDVSLGSAENPGLLIKNGQLNQLNLGLTEGGNLFGMEITSKDAVIEWNKTNNQFELFGGPIGLKYKEDSLFVDFGTEQAPGIVIKDGKFKSFNGKITENFQVGKLDFMTNNLGILYNSDKELFEISKGLVKIKVSSDSLIAHFGHDTLPGMIIEHGDVTEFNVLVSTYEKLLKLECKIDSINLAYNKNERLFQISGGPAKFDIEGDTIIGRFGTSAQPGVIIKDGKWQKFEMQVDGRFKLSKLEIEPKSLVFDYDISKDRILIYDSLEIIIDSTKIMCFAGNKNNPGIIISNSKLDSLDIEVNSDIKVSGLEFITKKAGVKRYVDKANNVTVELFGDYKLKKVWNAD